MAKRSKQRAAPPAPAESESETETSTEETTAMDDQSETVTEPTAESAPDSGRPVLPPNVYDELMTAARTVDASFPEQGTKDTDGRHFLRLVTELNKISDPVYEALSQGAKDWFNAAVLAIKGEEKVPTPIGFVSKFGIRAAGGGGGQKPAKEPKAPPAPKVRGESPSFQLRMLIAQNIKATPDELRKLLEDRKIEIGASSFTTVRSDVLATLDAAARVGWKLVSEAEEHKAAA